MKKEKTKAITLKDLKESDHHNFKMDKGLLGAEVGRYLTWEDYFLELFNKYRRSN